MNCHLDRGKAENAHSNLSPNFWQTQAALRNSKAIFENRQEQRT